MARLPKATAKKAAEAEGQDYTAVPEGVYTVRLREVNTDGKGQAGPYWRWELEITDEGDCQNRRLWVNTSLSDNALWKMNEVFTAFGYTTDTDTDEICGELCKAAVSQRVIESGSRKGEIGNNVEKMMALTEGGAEDGAEDDVF